MDLEYIEGLRDTDDYLRVILIYHFDLSKSSDLPVMPVLEDKLRNVFSTAAPKCPNPIGFSVFKLVSAQNSRLELEGMGWVEKTALFDIKPFVSDFDNLSDARNSWLSHR